MVVQQVGFLGDVRIMGSVLHFLPYMQMI